MGDFGKLGPICNEEVVQKMKQMEGPRELLSCCRRLNFCKCIENLCEKDQDSQIYCETCKYPAELCNDDICDNYLKINSNPTNYGLLILVILDIILTIAVIITIWYIEIKKKKKRFNKAKFVDNKKKLPPLSSTTTSPIPPTSSLSPALLKKKTSPNFN